MEGKDTIKNLFSQKLQNMEVPVNPEIWASISSQLPTIGTSSAVGFSTLSKILIGSSIAASIAVGSYFIFKDSDNPKNESKIKETILENKDSRNIDENTKAEGNSIKKDSVSISADNKFQLSNQIPNVNTNANESNTFEIGPNFDFNEESNKDVSISNSELVQDRTTESEEKKAIDFEDNQKESISNSTNNSILNNAKDESNNYPKTSELKIELPNVFTPNGDGKNDFLEFDTREIEDFSIVVLNEKGETIFQSSDNQFKWDGRMPNGDLVESGTLVYYIIGKDSNGKLVTKYSRLTVKY
jgi:gliding motility-associated-like protein